MTIFEKIKIRSKISTCKRRIEYLEHKRERSQAALVEAILSHQTPEDEDVEYFNKYTGLINEERRRMKDYCAFLEDNAK